MSDTTDTARAYELVTVLSRDGLAFEQLMKNKDIAISIQDVKDTGFLIMGAVILPYENFRAVFYEPSSDDRLQPGRVYVTETSKN